MLIILPRRRTTIPGRTNLPHKLGPRRLTFTARHHASTSDSQNGPIGPTTPALLTRTSIGPRDRSTFSIVSWTALASVTSTGNDSADPPADLISATVSSNSFLVR